MLTKIISEFTKNVKLFTSVEECNISNNSLANVQCSILLNSSNMNYESVNMMSDENLLVCKALFDKFKNIF